MAFGTFFLNRSHVVATIMKTKDKHYDEQFVTIRECNLIISLLKEKFNEEKVNVVILDHIDKYHFKIINGRIVPNDKNNISVEDIKKTYWCNDSTNKIANIIWDDSLIHNYLNEISTKKEKIEFEGSDLEKIITKVLNNPNEFYEKVAKELSVEEYRFIVNHLSINRSCGNCTKLCSGGPCDEACLQWKNDELVGKAKVLKKY